MIDNRRQLMRGVTRIDIEILTRSCQIDFVMERDFCFCKTFLLMCGGKIRHFGAKSV